MLADFDPAVSGLAAQPFELTGLFRALAEPTRLAILLTLQDGEQHITDLAAVSAAPRPRSPPTSRCSKTAA
jgi:hypothetical protein